MLSVREGKILATLVLAAAVLITAGVIRYQSKEKALETDTSNDLAAIADLKIGQINNWLAARRADALATAKNPLIQRAISDYLADQSNLGSRTDLRGWLTALQSSYGYSSAALYDRDGKLLLEFPPATAPQDVATRGLVQRAARDRQPVSADILLDPQNGTPRWTQLQPMASPQGEAAPVLLLQRNLQNFLYPLIQSWPTPSPTAETLLLRQEGMDMVFLNEPRHATNAAFTLRLPISPDSQGLWSKAGLGQEGPVQGIDYRGVAVVGVIRKVPGTSWIMISKIDHAEINAPLRADARNMILLVSTTLLALFLGGAWWWRQEKTHLLVRQLAAETALRKKDQRIVSLMQEANDAIIVFDEELRVVEFNDNALQLYRYPAEELVRLPVQSIRAPEGLPNQAENLAQFRSPEGADYETVHRRKDGTTFPVEVRGHATKTNGHFEIIAIIRDISRRKAEENHILQMNRLYAALSGVNQTIVQATTTDAMCEHVCRILVELGGFKMAWLGWLDPATKRILPGTVHGDVTGYTKNLVISAEDKPEGRGPSGTAFRESRVYVCNDFMADPHTGPWREAAREAGFNASISLPIRRNGEVKGLLTVYAGETDYFGEKEVELLREAAGDVSFALDNFDRVESARAAHEALQEREEILAAIFAQAVDSISLVEVETGRFAEFNAAAHLNLGYTRAEFAQLSVKDIEAEHTPATIRQNIDAMLSRPDGIVVESRHRRKNGELRDVRISARGTTLNGKRYLVGIWSDITERKRSEALLRETAQSLREAQRIGRMGSYELDVAGGFWISSEALDELLGIEAIQKHPVADWLALVHPADLAMMTEYLNQEVLGRGQDFDKEYRIVRQTDQVELWIWGRGKLELDAQGRVLKMRGTLTDITGRKKAAQEVQASEARFRELFEHAPIPLALSDKQGNVTYVNAQATVLFGYTRKEIPTLDAWWALAYPDATYRQELAGQWEKALAVAREQQCPVAPLECQVTCKDGQVRTVEISAKQLSKELLVIFFDLTERRQAEESLLHEQEFTRALLENLEAGVVACDSTGKLRLFNRAARDWHGLGPLDVAQTDWAGRYDLFEADGVTPMQLATVPLSRAMRQETVKGARMVIAAHGHPPRQIITNATQVMTEDGRPLGAVAVMNDITDQLASQARMQLQSAALNAAANAIVITDASGRIVWVNDAFTRQTGYSLAEALGQNPRVLKSGMHEEGFYRQLWETVIAGKVWHGELKNRRKDGTIYDEEMTITPLHSPAGKITHFIAIKQDITERHNLEKQYLRAQRMEGIGLLAGGIAHDLNNVLAPILMSAELMRFHELPPEVLSTIDMVETCAKRGADIVKQVLTFARGIEGEKGPVQLRHLIKDMIRMATETFPRNIHLKNLVPGDLRPIKGDSTQLHQILLNLSVNARDAMPAGGDLVFRAHNVQLTAADLHLYPGLQPGGYVKLEVSDTGTGIPPEVIERVFDPFFTTKEPGKGTGLGLSTVSGIVRSHGGYIEASSVPGRGTTFTVCFPALSADSEDGKQATKAELPQGRNELVLLVDDEPGILKTGANLLQHSGYRVVTAVNGADAITVYLMNQKEVAIVLTDIMMPTMDGVMLITQLHRLNPDIKCIVASGLMDNQNQTRLAELKQNGVKHFLAKPFSIEVMLEALDDELH
jgi:two-component system, cell cycle sensor histidine kinase and response regulator CckA